MSDLPRGSFNDAKRRLFLSPQEQKLYQTHLHNLWTDDGYTHPDGSRSSYYMTPHEENGRVYALPGVGEGRLFSREESVGRARRQGLDNFPSYGSHEELAKRYGQLHDYMEKDNDQREGVVSGPLSVGDVEINQGYQEGGEVEDQKDIAFIPSVPQWMIDRARGYPLPSAPKYEPGDTGVLPDTRVLGQSSWNLEPQVTPWPTKKDVDEARAYKQRYGNPNEVAIDPYQTTTVFHGNRERTPSGQFGEWILGSSDPVDQPKREVYGQQSADTLYGSQLAANVNPAAALGFDPKAIAITRPEDANRLGGTMGITKSGMKNTDRYIPNRMDQSYPMWAYIGGEPASTPVHESIHRGIQYVLDDPANADLVKRLKAYDDYVPKNVKAEDRHLYDYATSGNEYATRALMLRHYGDVEYEKRKASGIQELHPQIERARNFLKYDPKFVTLLNDIQQRAAHMGAQRLIDKGQGPALGYRKGGRVKQKAFNPTFRAGGMIRKGEGDEHEIKRFSKEDLSLIQRDDDYSQGFPEDENMPPHRGVESDTNPYRALPPYAVRQPYDPNAPWDTEEEEPDVEDLGSPRHPNLGDRPSDINETPGPGRYRRGGRVKRYADGGDTRSMPDPNQAQATTLQATDLLPGGKLYDPRTAPDDTTRRYGYDSGGGSANAATGSGGDAAGGVSGTGGIGGSATDSAGGSAAAGVGGDDGGTYWRGGPVRAFDDGGMVGHFATGSTDPSQGTMQPFGYDPKEYVGKATQWADTWKNRGDTEYNWGVDQFNKNSGVADQITQQAMGNAGLFDNAASAGLSRYQNTYVPAMKQFLDYATSYASPDNMARARGQAMAGVGQAFDAQSKAAADNLRSYGLAPQDISARLDSSVRTQRAAAEAGAGTMSDINRELVGAQLTGTAIGQGMADAGLTNQFAGIGTAERNQAINTALANTASGVNARNQTGWSSMGGQELKEWPKAELDAMDASNKQGSLWNDINKTNLAAQQQQYSQGSGFGALIGAGLGMASNFLLPGSGAVAGPLLTKLGGSIGGGGGYSGGPFGSTGGSSIFGGLAQGGVAGDPAVPAFARGAIQTGPIVPPQASVPGIQGPDKVPAMVQAGEGIVPKIVMEHLGRQGFNKFLQKQYKEMGMGPQPIGGQDKPVPRQAIQTGPTFASQGAVT